MRYDENGNVISNDNSVEQEFAAEDGLNTNLTNETVEERNMEREMKHPEEAIVAKRQDLTDAMNEDVIPAEPVMPAASKEVETARPVYAVEPDPTPAPPIPPVANEQVEPEPVVAPAAPVVEKSKSAPKKPEVAASNGGNGGGGNGRPPKNNNGGNSGEPPAPKKGGFKGGFIGGLVGGLVMVLIGGGAFYGYSQTQDNATLTSNSGTTDTVKNVKTTNVSANVTTDTTEAVTKVEDSVVSVINMASSQSGILQGDSDFGTSSDSESDLETQSEGSGVIYKKDGDTAYVVTNNHVIDGSDAVEVLLKDGTKVEAKVVGADEWTDLAVLSIPSEHVKKVATFGNSDDIKVGEPAIAIGSPLGTNFATSVTQGIISAKNRSVAMDVNGDGVEDWDMTAIQTDAAINPGNSGGALINLAGQVVGINSMKISQDTVEGMGFAIPSNDVVKIINELESNGKIVRPVLGVGLRDLSQISAQQQKSVLNLPEDVTDGIVITSVEKNSAASKGGLKQYDTIVEIAGEKVTDSISLRKVIYNQKVGSTVEVKYYRDGKEKTAKVTLSAADSL